MSALGFFIAVLTTAGAYLSFQAPTERDMVESFGEAQRFYAEGAYDQAIERYREVARVHSRVLDAQAVHVEVGEQAYPVQEASLYQIGNAYTKLYGDYSRFSSEAAVATRRTEYRDQADSAFAKAIDAFEGVIHSASSEVLRSQAHGRVIELYFEAESYPRAIESAQELLARDPTGPDAVVAYYNMGWAHFEMREYPEAIDAFQKLVETFPAGYRTDRSLFQIGECYLAMEDYDQAVASYRLLVERQHIDELTEAELERMKREKLAGLVDETALEMAAKAEIRIGTCYAKLGRYDEGVATYDRVIALFSTERQLVEEAYLQKAQLYEDRGDPEAAERTLRQAIDATSDRTLKARIQYKLAERLVTEKRYEEAVQEYRIYLRGYGDIASSVGLTVGRARYRIGSAYQQLAQQRVEAQGLGSGSEWLQRAVAQYDTLMQDADSPYHSVARFNHARALQALGTDASLSQAAGEYVESIAAADEYSQPALVKLAELHYGRGNYDESLARARQLLASYPGSDYRDEAQWYAGLSLQGLGQGDAAAAQFLEIDAESRFYAGSRLNAGHILLGLRRYDEAIQALQAGLAVSPPEQVGTFHYLLGQADSGQQRYRPAIAHFDTALANPMGRTLEEALRFSRGNLSFIVEDYDQGEQDFSWVIANVSDPKRVRDAQDALTLSYLRQNRGGEALRVLDQMLSTAATPEDRASLLSRITDLYYQRDDYEQTARLAERLVGMTFTDGTTPERPYTLRDKSYFLWGDALLRLGRADEAAAKFREALERDPNSHFAPVMRLNLAIHLFSAGDLEQAKAAFIELQGMDLEPSQATLVDFYLANTHYSLREFAAARRVFGGLLSRPDVEAQLPDVIFGLAESDYQLGEFEAAIDNYRRLLQEYPTESAADDAQYNMAWSLIELQREKEAMEAFGQLLRNYPNSELAASAQFTFGDYAFNQGDYRGALEAYEKVEEEYPDAEVASQVPRLVGELKEAIAYEEYEKAMALLDSAEASQSREVYEAAVQAFTRIQERYPGTESEIGALSNMGVCLEALGEWQRAVEVYDKVMKLHEEERATREAFQFAKAHRDWIVSARL